MKIFGPSYFNKILKLSICCKNPLIKNNQIKQKEKNFLQI